MRDALAENLRRRSLRPAGTRAERVARRNITFSPANGTRVIAQPRLASRRAGQYVARQPAAR
jgi:hypothetical protein